MDERTHSDTIYMQVATHQYIRLYSEKLVQITHNSEKNQPITRLVGKTVPDASLFGDRPLNLI